jgi:hypothetical protein
MPDWSTWGAPIIASVVGVAAGASVSDLAQRRQSQRRERETSRRTLLALFDELHYIWETSREFASASVWAPFPTDAFEGAKGYLTELPVDVAVVVRQAETRIATFNVIARSDVGILTSVVKAAVGEVERYVGTAYGRLEEYLEVGVHSPPTK